jgi:SAM-dependent methyltransferase
MSTIEAPPDLAEVTARQRQVWSTGDYSVIANLIHPVSERLVDDADLHAGWRVLDVATGSGNAAIAAARLGAEAVGIDYVPALLERARERVAAERLDVRLAEADAHSLPFGDGEFDAVTSVFGVMFAPHHRRAAAELLRVTRPGGRIALASWTPDSFIGELFRTVSAHVPPPPGVPSPMLWGTEEHLYRLLGDHVEGLTVTERTFTFRFPSPEEFVTFFRLWYGPTLKAFAALNEIASDALESDLVELATQVDRLGGDAVAIPATYIEALATRR